MLIGIVADDLTGAADSVAPFAQQGYVSGVSFWGGEPQDPPWDALSLMTGLRDRRDLKPTLIASIARRITRRLIKHAPQVYFKKIDSTLRGHLRVELDGMLRELPGRVALICPASPANERAVENGVLRVQGVPLPQTEFVRDAEPTEKFATVRSAFEMGDDPTAAEIGLATIREGVATVEAELERQIAAGVRTVFFDAVTPDDLRTLAQIVLNRPERYLPVGAAGFTRAIAETLPGVADPYLPPWDTGFFTRGRVLVVVGSMHSMSRLQARRVIEGTCVRHIIPEPGDGWSAGADILSFRGQFPDEKLFLLMTPNERHAKGFYSFHSLFYMLSLREEKQEMTLFDGYVVSGGEMAQQVCEMLRGSNLQIFGESEPGIVRAVLNRMDGLASVLMILKAGGFGDAGTLARCVGLE